MGMFRSGFSGPQRMFVPLTANLSIIYINTFHQGKQVGTTKPAYCWGAGELSVRVESCYLHPDKAPL